MKFIATEIAMMVYSLRTQNTNQGVQPRTFMVDELRKAMDLFDKLVAMSEGEGEQKKFIDGETEITVEEKVFMLKLLERPWNVDEGKIYFDLKEKLNK